MNTVYGHILNVSPMWGPMQYINSDAGQGKRLLAWKHSSPPLLLHLSIANHLFSVSNQCTKIKRVIQSFHIIACHKYLLIYSPCWACIKTTAQSAGWLWILFRRMRWKRECNFHNNNTLTCTSKYTSFLFSYTLGR